MEKPPEGLFTPPVAFECPIGPFRRGRLRLPRP